VNPAAVVMLGRDRVVIGGIGVKVLRSIYSKDERNIEDGNQKGGSSVLCCDEQDPREEAGESMKEECLRVNRSSRSGMEMATRKR